MCLLHERPSQEAMWLAEAGEDRSGDDKGTVWGPFSHYKLQSFQQQDESQKLVLKENLQGAGSDVVVLYVIS